MRRLSGCISRALIGAGDLPLDGGARRLLAFGRQGIEGAADNAGVGFFRVTNLPSVVNVFVGQTGVGGSGNLLLVWKKVGSLPLLPDLTAILRRIEFIGEATLGV